MHLLIITFSNKGVMCTTIVNLVMETNGIYGF